MMIAEPRMLTNFEHILLIMMIIELTMMTNESRIELFVKSLKEGLYCGFDPSLRKLCMKCSLAHRTLEPLLKVGCKFWDFLFPPLKL